MRGLALVVVLVAACGESPVGPCGAQACACVEGTEQPCAGGSDVGICRRGTQRCEGGVLQACTGRVDPELEVCNTLDDDCDGDVDGALALEQCEAVPGAIGVSCAEQGCVASCAPGFDDCNGTYADGCEADLGVSATCGSCGNPCSGGLVCELGECVVLPRVVWSNKLGINKVTGLAIDEAGHAIVVGGLQAPMTLGGLSIDPTDPGSSGTSDLFLARVGPSGTAEWLRRDGVVAVNEFPNFTAYSGDGSIYVGGFVSGGVTQLAGQQLPQGEFRAAYSSFDGSGRWATSLPRTSFMTAGPAGLDVTDGSTAVRLDADTGGVLASTSVPGATSLRPVAQLADGRTLVFGISDSRVEVDCTLSPSINRTAFVARIDHPSGQCDALHLVEVTGTISFRENSIISWVGGSVIVSGLLDGTMLGMDVSIVSQGKESFLLAFDATGRAAWFKHEPAGTAPQVAGDDRGNVYVFSTAMLPPLLQSFRSDGVLRWSEVLFGVSSFFPGEAFATGSGGEIVLALAGDGGQPITIGETTITDVGPFTLVYLEGR